MNETVLDPPFKRTKLPKITLESEVVVSAKKSVLNKWEIELYNLLEEYFSTRQLPHNECAILAQVSLTQFINVDKIYLDGVQVNALSVDCLVASLTSAKPLIVFEADGYFHGEKNEAYIPKKDLSSEDEEKRRRATEEQRRRDKVKDRLLVASGIPVLRFIVQGVMQDERVVQHDVEFGLGSGIEVPFASQNEYPDFIEPSDKTFPHVMRLINSIDIERALDRLVPA